MMHNVNTAVQQADALLVIVDATSNLAEVLEMPGMARGWSGPPAALVSPVQPAVVVGKGGSQTILRLRTVTVVELSCGQEMACLCLLAKLQQTGQVCRCVGLPGWCLRLAVDGLPSCSCGRCLTRWTS
jgi:hypothetical protein